MTVLLLRSSHLPGRSKLSCVCGEESRCHLTSPVAPEGLPSTGLLLSSPLRPECCQRTLRACFSGAWCSVALIPGETLLWIYFIYSTVCVPSPLSNLLEWNHRHRPQNWRDLRSTLVHVFSPTAPALWAQGRACRHHGLPISVPASFLICCYLSLGTAEHPHFMDPVVGKKTTLLSVCVYTKEAAL